MSRERLRRHCLPITRVVVCACVFAASPAQADTVARTAPKASGEYRLRVHIEQQFDGFLTDCNSKPDKTESPIPKKLWNYEIVTKGGTTTLAKAGALKVGQIDPTTIFSELFDTDKLTDLSSKLTALATSSFRDRRWIPSVALTPIKASPGLHYNGTCEDYVSLQSKAGYNSPWFKTEIEAKLSHNNKADLSFSVGHFVSPAVKILEDKGSSDRTGVLFSLWREFAARKLKQKDKRFLIREFLGIPYYRAADEHEATSLRAKMTLALDYFGASLSSDDAAATGSSQGISATTKGVLILGSEKVSGDFQPLVKTHELDSPSQIQSALLSAIAPKSPSDLKLDAGQGSSELNFAGAPSAACDKGQWQLQLGEQTAKLVEMISDKTTGCKLKYEIKDLNIVGSSVAAKLKHVDAVDGLELSWSLTVNADDSLTIKPTGRRNNDDYELIVADSNVSHPPHWLLKGRSLLDNPWTCIETTGVKHPITPTRTSDRFIFKGFFQSITQDVRCSSDGEVVSLKLVPPDQTQRTVYRRILGEYVAKPDTSP